MKAKGQEFFVTKFLWAVFFISREGKRSAAHDRAGTFGLCARILTLLGDA